MERLFVMRSVDIPPVIFWQVTSHQSFSNPNFLLASINSEPLFFYDVKTIMVKDQLYTTAGACLDSVNPLWHVQ